MSAEENNDIVTDLHTDHINTDAVDEKQCDRSATGQATLNLTAFKAATIASLLLVVRFSPALTMNSQIT